MAKQELQIRDMSFEFFKMQVDKQIQNKDDFDETSKPSRFPASWSYIEFLYHVVSITD